MELILLGTGTCSVTAKRSMSAAAVKADGFTLLIDCGAGAIRRMAESGILIHDVDAICFTHLHPDHVADLAPLLFSRKYDPLKTQSRGLTLAGPAGFGRFLKNLDGVYEHHLLDADAWPAVTDVDGEGGAIEAGPFTVVSRTVDHAGGRAVGYRVTRDGSAIAFSGDTGPCPALAELAREADLFVCECSVPDAAEVPGHMTPRHVGQTAAEAGCRKVVLTHLYPMMDEIDAVAAVKKCFDGDVVKGEDGMIFSIVQGGKKDGVKD